MQKGTTLIDVITINVVSHCGKSYFLFFLRGTPQFMAHCLYSWLIVYIHGSFSMGVKSKVPVRGAGHPGGYALAAAIQVAVNAR